MVEWLKIFCIRPKGIYLWQYQCCLLMGQQGQSSLTAWTSIVDWRKHRYYDNIMLHAYQATEPKDIDSMNKYCWLKEAWVLWQYRWLHAYQATGPKVLMLSVTAGRHSAWFKHVLWLLCLESPAQTKHVLKFCCVASPTFFSTVDQPMICYRPEHSIFIVLFPSLL